MFRFFAAFTLLFQALQADDLQLSTQKAYLANINALMLFTSREHLGSGRYAFTRADMTMAITHFPLRFQSDDYFKNINLFILGGVGYSESTMTGELDEATAQNDFMLTTTNMLRTYTAGLGGGVRYHDRGFEATLGLENIYSRVGIRSKDGVDVEGQVDDFFNGRYNDNLSYRVFTELTYKTMLYRFKPYAALTYELFETKSAFRFDTLTRFSTQSSALSFSVGAETPPLVRYGDMNLTAEGYLQGAYLGGDINKVVKLDGYGATGWIVYLYTPDVPYVRRFYLEANTIHADGLRGYNIGLGLSLE